MVGQRNSAPAANRALGAAKTPFRPDAAPRHNEAARGRGAMPKPVESSQDSRLDAFFTAAPAGLAILYRELRYVQLIETLAAMNGCSDAEQFGRSGRQELQAQAAILVPYL